MHAKYADVVSTAEILSYFDQAPADLFDLPTSRRSPGTLVKGGGRIAGHDLPDSCGPSYSAAARRRTLSSGVRYFATAGMRPG